MKMSTRMVRWVFWPVAVVLVLGTTALVWRYGQQSGRVKTNVNAAANNNDTENPNGDPTDDGVTSTEPPKVDVILPRRGAMQRITTLPCTVEADEVNIHTQVSGILKALGEKDKKPGEKDKKPVDLGMAVKKGDVLAIIDVPEIEKIVERNEAAVDQAKARVEQMRAKVAIAKADVKGAEAQVVYAEAFARSATAYVVFRNLKYDRIHKLVNDSALEGALEEEARQQRDAARESENAAKAAIVTNHAKVTSEEAKVLKANADVLEAESQVKVAQAELDRSKVRLNFASIRAEFDGIITTRPLVPGTFIRSAAETNYSQSIMTIQRTNPMRVVVQIPDRDARYADPGDEVTLEIDGIPDTKFKAVITRTRKAEDKVTRQMRVEIDIDNPDGIIRNGMYGKATIILVPAAKEMSIPAACVVGQVVNGAANVYVVRNGKAELTKIQIGANNHSNRVEVVSGLEVSDRVLARPPSTLTNGAEVVDTLVDDAKLD